ncbi:MFS general substrate transporter [Neoconidiobolus thromboides FSU 785]|nr:MFS general substrate transporter [Neoconidiobolus thromboides FSU 785]
MSEIKQTSQPADSVKGEESGNFFIRLLQKHYGRVYLEKSEKQILREKYLIPNVISFNRWFLFPASVLLQFCCGSLYAWSVYNTPIDKYIYGYDAKMAPITFYIAVGFFGFSTAVMGPWLERKGPLLSGLTGTSLFFLGNLLTGLALYVRQIWLVYVGYGVIGGFGLGLCYITPVSALQKWFPDKRGLGSGFAVCGFGAGSIVTALIPLPLISAVDLPLTFVIMGSCFFVLMVLASSVLRTPPPGYIVNGLDIYENKQIVKPAPSLIELSLIDSLLSREFRLMYAVFFANAVFGLVVISRLSNMITDIFGQPKEVAAQIVSVNGGFNLFGRLFFSILSDYVGRKWCYVIMISFQLIILGCFSTMLEHQAYWAFVVTMWILTACYGGGFGVIPAFLTDMFGPSNIGACHGVILTAWSLAGVGGGLVFTAVFNHLLAVGYTSKDLPPYTYNVWWIFAIVTIGWFTLFFLRVSLQDRLLPKKEGELIRLRVATYVIRVYHKPGFKVEVLKKAQFDQEWQEYLTSKNNS